MMNKRFKAACLAALTVGMLAISPVRAVVPEKKDVDRFLMTFSLACSTGLSLYLAGRIRIFENQKTHLKTAENHSVANSQEAGYADQIPHLGEL